MRNTLSVYPDNCKSAQRNTEVNERKQREETIIHAPLLQEIAHQRGTEDRQGIQPFRGSHSRKLRQLVPGQPIAIYTRDIYQPQHNDTRVPGKPPEAPVTIEHEVAQHVQYGKQYHPVGSITMQAAHYAAQIP